MDASIYGPMTNNIWKFIGTDLDKDQGKKVFKVIEIFGLKSLGANLCKILANLMHHMGYVTYKYDLGFWFKPTVRPDDGT